MSEEHPDKSEFENRVILVVILTGFIGSVVLYFLKVPPIVMSIFLGSGISALVYRFLGGAAGASFVMGTLKLSGSIAVLLGSAYYINQQLERQLKPISKIEKVTFSPQKNTWIALDKSSGKAVEIKINETDQVITTPANSPFRNNPLKLHTNGEKIYISSEGDQGFFLGQISKSELKSLNLYNTIISTGNYVVTDRLEINKHANLTPLPFNMRTTAYANEYSEFQLLDRTSGEAIYSSQIYRRRFQLAQVGDKNYMIGVVEVNHSPKNPDDPNSREPYAKFVIAEIVAELK